MPQNLASENRRLIGLGGLDRYSSYDGEGTQANPNTSFLSSTKSFLGSKFDKDIEDAREEARNRVKLKFREGRSGGAVTNSLQSTKSREETMDDEDGGFADFANELTTPSRREDRGEVLEGKPKPSRTKETGN